MPKLTTHPVPVKRYHGGRWRIIWHYQRKQYALPTEYVDPKNTSGLDQELRQISWCLASDEPNFPPKYAELPVIKKYIVVRYGQPELQEDIKVPVEHDFDALLERFDAQSKLEYSRGWHSAMMGHLASLKKQVGNLGSTTPAQAREYLAAILAKGRTPATRNRAMVACSTFYNWLIQGEYVEQNPFRGIKQLKELHGHKDIVYCTREERDRIVAMAKATEWNDWIAVPIAFYAGMRKEEIARMQWRDVLFNEGRVIVPITKTKERRVLPLTSRLREILAAIPESEREGFVVKMPTDMDRVFRLENLHRKVRKLNTGVGRWKKDKSKNKPEGEKNNQPIPDERIGWNAWRHTFGSLLAQAGVSLDKISSWMGNTPDVCRRHYAQFVPRGVHDEDIEKL